MTHRSFCHTQVGVKNRPSPWKRYPHPFAAHVNRRAADISFNPSFIDVTPFIYARAITLYHVPLLSPYERHIAITDWSDYSSQPHFLNLLKLSNYRQTPFFHLNYSHLPENSTKFYSRTYSYNILCNIKMDIYTIHTHHYDELCRTVFYKARDIGTAFYSSTIFQQSGTFYINSSPEDPWMKRMQMYFWRVLYRSMWNSGTPGKPLVEYIPNVPKRQDTVEVQIYSHIREIWSLLSYIKSAIYFPCVNNLHSFAILEKLNTDLTNNPRAVLLHQHLEWLERYKCLVPSLFTSFQNGKCLSLQVYNLRQWTFHN